MSESTKPERKEINELLDRLEDNGWVVRDYNPDVDPENPLQVDLTVERRVGPNTVTVGTSKSQRDRIRNVKHVIQDLEDSRTDGVPIEEAVETVVNEFDVNPSFVRNEIERLKEKGEIYEPRTDHLRTT